MSIRLLFLAISFVALTAEVSFAQQEGSLQQLRQEQQAQTQQQNQKLMEQMGYLPPPSAQQISSGRYYDDLALKKQAKERELFAEINPPAAYNNTSQASSAPKIEDKKGPLYLADTTSSFYTNYKQYYRSAFAELNKMLEGKVPLSLKRAVFLTENAFHRNKLNYDRYSKQIDSLVYIAKQIIKDKGLSPTNFMACHYAIQKLFSERITYKTVSGKEAVFTPLSYDFSTYDEIGNDWTEQFVTRLLNRKMGQCHSMPLLYLILAEELNANAYLALAPNHSYIKFGNQTESFCFETTNGTLTSDDWIVSSGYISASAIKNQIYLAPLTKKQVIAECLNDLGEGFEFLVGKSSFEKRCARTVLVYYPKSIRSALLISNVAVAECAKTAGKYGYPKYEEYTKYSDLKKEFDNMLELELMVENTGYQKIPPEQYEKWRQTANEEKERRKNQKLTEKLETNAVGQ